MSGVVKKKYISETMKYKQEFTRQLKNICDVLPYDYDKQTILSLYKEFYPMEWDRLVHRYDYYNKKDTHLLKVGKKKRYFHETPEKFFLNLNIVKHLASSKQRLTHKKSFELNKRLIALERLKHKRQDKIINYNEKIEKATRLSQSIEPLYMDVFISAYHKKGSTIEDKLEVFNELKKFRCEKTIDFFQKLNDCEKNNQIRRLAFEHLQRNGFYVKLRKKFKGKVKAYFLEKNSFCVTPKDLVNRIESNSIQNRKRYDVFLSHSFQDADLVLQLKNVLNKHGLSVYCDWTSDNDFLKRELASEYTEVVLKKRIEQSSTVLFLQTNNSIDINGNVLSNWVDMELAFAKKLSKKIYSLNTSGQHAMFEPISHEIKENGLLILETEVKRFCTNKPIK